jgi:hypothetical protein
VAGRRSPNDPLDSATSCSTLGDASTRSTLGDASTPSTLGDASTPQHRCQAVELPPRSRPQQVSRVFLPANLASHPESTKRLGREPRFACLDHLDL